MAKPLLQNIFFLLFFSPSTKKLFLEEGDLKVELKLTFSKNKIDYIELRVSKCMSEWNNNVTFVLVVQAYWP